MSAYKIRVACPSDLDAVFAIFSQADKLHRAAHPEIFQKADDPADIRDFLLTGIKSDDAAVFVADLNGTIIGAIIAWVRQTPDIPMLVPRRYVSVDNLIVDEQYQHQGVGQALMEQIHAWTRSLGLKNVHLTVWDFNQGALAFYEKLGYKMLHHQMRKELF
jgi:ribosomal protein S18 acetylase RimI-like enzyme